MPFDYNREFPKEIATLNRFIENDQDNQTRIKDFERTLDEALSLAEQMKASGSRRESGNTKMLHYHYAIQLLDIPDKCLQQLDEIEKRFKQIREENALAVGSQSDLLLYASLVLGLIVNAIIAILIYRFAITRITSKLKVVTDNTVNLMLGKPLLEPLSGTDEIAELDAEFREMARSLEYFRSKEAKILENAANFICSLDAKGVFIDVPRASSAMWGFGPDELIGRRFVSVVASETSEKTRHVIEKLVESQSIVSFENKITCKDGKVLDLAWTFNKRADSRLVCVAHDITKRNRMLDLIRKSEERFGAIIENLPIALIGCDRSFAIDSVNPGTTKMFGYQPNELLGKRLNVLFSTAPKPGEDLSQLADQALKQTIEMNCFAKDGKQIPVELDLSISESVHGDRYLAGFRDISARVEIESLKRNFISMISHDLRSPLMALYGTLGMIVETGATTGGSDGTQLYAESEQIIGELLKLINDYLDLGKVETGPGALVMSHVELSTVLEESIKLAKNSDVTCKIEMSEPAKDITLRIDLDRMTLTLGCLIQVLATFNESLEKIVIATRIEAQSVHITIGGTGSNRLPDEVKDTLKEGYTHLPESGLRLALARAIVLAHRGQLSVVDAGDGEHFELKLPR